jgi:hypothetical protein
MWAIDNGLLHSREPENILSVETSPDHVTRDYYDLIALIKPAGQYPGPPAPGLLCQMNAVILQISTEVVRHPAFCSNQTQAECRRKERM